MYTTIKLRKKNVIIKKELDWTKLYGIGKGLRKDRINA